MTPVYTYRKETLIQRLEITSAEMPHMTRLIDDDEKRRRDREAWRTAHTGRTISEHLEQRAEQGAARAARAKALRDGGLSWAEVAQRMELAGPEAARKLASRAK